MIVIHSNFFSTMLGFRDNDVLLPTGHDVIVSSPPGALHAIFHDGFWKSDHNFLIAFHSKYISGMHGFRDNKVYCKPDMTSSWFCSQGVFQAIFHDGFCKSDHDFLIAFHSNFLSAMHGFRDNEVLFHTGYDVIVISPLVGVSGDFSWRILKEWPWFPISG